MKLMIVALERGDESTVAFLDQQLRSLLPPEWVQRYTFVAMPSSTVAAGSLQSLVRRLRAADTRDLLIQTCRTPSSHNGWRPAPQERANLMALNEAQADPKPQVVVIVDDVLTTGCHFRAAKMIVRQRWPQMRVLGVFLARVPHRQKGVWRLAETRP